MFFLSARLCFATFPTNKITDMRRKLTAATSKVGRFSSYHQTISGQRVGFASLGWRLCDEKACLYLSVYLSIHPSIYQPSVYLSNMQSTNQSIYLSIYLFLGKGWYYRYQMVSTFPTCIRISDKSNLLPKSQAQVGPPRMCEEVHCRCWCRCCCCCCCCCCCKWCFYHHTAQTHKSYLHLIQNINYSILVAP